MRFFLIAGAASLLVSGVVAAAAPIIFHNQWHFAHKWSEARRMPRHHAVLTRGVPVPYATMRNPLPMTPATIDRGAAVYAANCASCHGPIGEGNGVAGRQLSPLPGDLAWLSEMRISLSDGFMYWTIAEGGVPFGTAMPPYREKLSGDDIWAVTTFIRAQLPRTR